MFEVYFGCEEWQDVNEFETLKEAQKYAAEKARTMGLYTADEAWIKNDTTGYYEEIEI